MLSRYGPVVVFWSNSARESVDSWGRSFLIVLDENAKIFTRTKNCELGRHEEVSTEYGEMDGQWRCVDVVLTRVDAQFFALVPDQVKKRGF